MIVEMSVFILETLVLVAVLTPFTYIIEVGVRGRHACQALALLGADWDVAAGKLPIASILIEANLLLR